MLQISGNSYKMEDVSVDRGFVVIITGPIHKICYDRNGRPTPATGIGNISLKGTPFFSKRNKLVATGCNYLLVANFGNSIPADNLQHTNCFSWCNGTSNAVSCLYGVACCEALVPMDAAQEFTLMLEKVLGQVTDDEDDTCSAAFFLDQDDQVFKGGTDGGQRPLKGVLPPAGDHRMILDWAIGLGTCDQAWTYNLELQYCNSMSGCIDAPRGAGYPCRCNAGYGGNPYTTDGCAGKYFFIHHRDIHDQN
jgi:hypothetical protein